jgi:hypothetical protein
MNFFKKIFFGLQKPRLILVCDNANSSISKTIYKLLSNYVRVEKFSGSTPSFFKKDEVLIYDIRNQETDFFRFLIKNSRQPILVVNQADRNRDVLNLVKILPEKGNLIFNFDNEENREFKNFTKSNVFTFGFQAGSDLKISDLKINHEVNFKINYKGNIVPVWLDYINSNEGIYSVLAAILTAIVFDLNLVEISQALKSLKIEI